MTQGALPTKGLFVISGPAFEGPLELLLHLVEERKMVINDVSLATVTDDFLRFVEDLPNFDVKMVTQFVSVATTLVLIKARSLLPDVELSDEEESDVEELEHRLKAYEKVTARAKQLGSRWGTGVPVSRPNTISRQIVFRPSPMVKTSTLYGIMSELVHGRLREHREEYTKKPVMVTMANHIKLEEVMDRISKAIAGGVKFNISDMIPSSETDHRIRRVYTIVSFLAVLEMVKNGFVHALQSEIYGNVECGPKVEENI